MISIFNLTFRHSSQLTSRQWLDESDRINNSLVPKRQVYKLGDKHTPRQVGKLASFSSLSFPVGGFPCRQRWRRLANGVPPAWSPDTAKFVSACRIWPADLKMWNLRAFVKRFGGSLHYGGTSLETKRYLRLFFRYIDSLRNNRRRIAEPY